MAKIDNEKEIKAKKIELEDVDDNEEYESISVEDRIVNIEKKTNTILVIVSIMLALVVINVVMTATGGSSSSSSEVSESSGSYDVSSFKKISGSDISSESKDATIVVMMGRQGCGYCAQFAPTLKSVQDTYDFKARYIDLTDIVDLSSGSITDKDAYNALMDLGVSNTCKSIAYDNEGKEVGCKEFMETEFGATPLTLIIKNNKLEYAVAGAIGEDEFGAVLEEVGFSK